MLSSPCAQTKTHESSAREGCVTWIPDIKIFNANNESGRMLLYHAFSMNKRNALSSIGEDEAPSKLTLISLKTWNLNETSSS